MTKETIAAKPAVLLDIDDTLLDFHKAEAVALAKALREMHRSLSEAEQVSRPCMASVRL